MSKELYNQTTKGVRWSFADNVINQGVAFIVGIVLARILSPDEYGLIGIITIFITVSNSIIDSGFSSALIRKTDIKDEDYSTVFISNLVISIVLFLVLFFSAPLIARFFAREELVALTKVMASVLIINALGIVQRSILSKRIDFKTQAIVSLISSISSGIIGIVMAIKGFGVWSLVGQQLSRQLLNTIFLWVFNFWFPKLKFSIKSFKELFSFGSKLMLSGIINTVWTQLYNVVIGRFYSSATLGQFTKAQQFSNMFSSNITGVVQRVSYPALSSIQNDRERLKAAYQKVIKVTMLLTCCCMIGLAAVAKPLVLVLIGEQWLPCVPFLQLICFEMMLYPLHALNLNMLEVQGRSDLFLKLEIIKKFVAVVPLLLGIFINIYWMLGCGIFAGFFAYYLNAYYSGTMIGYSFKEQIKDVLPSFSIAFGMGLLVFPLSLLNVSPFIILPIQIILGILLVMVFCKITKLAEYEETKVLIIEALGKVVNR